MANDPYWNNVTALLHFDGADASTTFFDERGHTFTAFGNAQIDTTQSVSGGASGLFDGSGDYLSTPDSPDFNLSAGDWTIEAWIRINALSSGTMLIVDKDGQAFVSYAQWMLSVTAAGKLQGSIGSGNGTSSQQTVTGATTISIGAWHHVAFTLSGTTLRLFLDGVLDVSATKTATMIAHTKALLVGWQLNQQVDNYFNGHIDELRITKGVARYTANFTVPAEAFPNRPPQLLGTVTCADDCGTVSTIGDVPTLTFGAITADSAADNGGVAAWGRAKSGEATPVAVLDFDISTVGGSGFGQMNNTNVVKDGPISAPSVVITA